MSDYQKYVTNDRTTGNSRMREVHEWIISVVRSWVTYALYVSISLLRINIQLCPWLLVDSAHFILWS